MSRNKRTTAPKPVTGDVGYGRPLRAHKFKPGCSGNPRGRPKGSKNEATILNGILNRKIAVRQGGTSRKIAVLEAILMRFAEEALKGNTKSAAFLLNRYGRTEADEASPDAELSAEDRAVLETFARRIESKLRDKEDNQCPTTMS